MLHVLVAAWLVVAPEPAATIQGVVRAERTLEPIPFATVTIRELERRVQTDAHGFFVVSGVPAGRWRVESTALGYDANALTVVTADNGTVRLDFELRLRPVPLPGVLVRTDEATAAFSAPSDPGPAAVRMSALSLKTIPGLAEPDILRGLQLLPSVAAMSDYSTALYVRGGAADQNLLQLDGMPLFNPYHIGGILSAVPADALSTVDVWPGALPARFGDRLSSVVVINTREGGKDHVRTSGGIGLLSANATVDGPIRGGRGSFLLSGRRTYIDAITAVADGVGLLNDRLPYRFTDLYGKLTHRVGELGSVSISGYWDGEGIHARERDELDDFGELQWGSRLTSLSYRQPIGGSLLLEARAGYTDFKGDFDGWAVRVQGGPIVCDDNGCDYSLADVDTVQVVLAHTKMHDVVASADLTWFRNRHTLRGGVLLDRYVFDHALTNIDSDDDYLAPFAQRSTLTNLAAYVEGEWQPNDRFGVRGGIRLLFAGRLGTALLPRLAARWQVAPSFAITAGGGRYAQALRSMKDDESNVASIIAYDILTAQPTEAGLARGVDLVAGAEYADRNTRVRLEAFVKQQDALVLAPETETAMYARPLLVDDYRIGTGSARGLEVSAHRIAGRFDLGLTYALGAAERRAGADVFAPRFERRHQLDLSSDYRWGDAGLLSARLIVGSGQPFTPAIGIAQPREYNPLQQRWTETFGDVVSGEHNSARMPAYVRLDIAARRSYRRRWFGRDGAVTPYIQVVNVLNNRNVLFAEPRGDGTPRIRYWPQLPILPTVGVEWRF